MLKKSINKCLGLFNVKVIQNNDLDNLLEHKLRVNNGGFDISFLNKIIDQPETISLVLPLFEYSTSQIRQDLFVLLKTGFKKRGYFVEFGATDGLKLSNTFILENKFGWDGILCEPGRVWQNDLSRNRSCNISINVVSSKSNLKIDFDEFTVPELSTIANINSNLTKKDVKRTYSVESISLLDLLKKYNAPKEIDYLSIDTEGSEFEILNAFDFSKHTFKVITCEHNFSDQRNKIHTLLTAHNYIRVYDDISSFDDWYLHQSMIS
jgi:FkbM family methyltransferase